MGDIVSDNLFFFQAWNLDQHNWVHADIGVYFKLSSQKGARYYEKETGRLLEVDRTLTKPGHVFATMWKAKYVASRFLAEKLIDECDSDNTPKRKRAAMLSEYLLEREVFQDPQKFFTSDAVFGDIKAKKMDPLLRVQVKKIVRLYLTEEKRPEKACSLCHTVDPEVISPCRVCLIFDRTGGCEDTACRKCGTPRPCEECDKHMEEDAEVIGEERLDEIQGFCQENRTPGPDGNLPAIPGAEALREELLEAVKRNRDQGSESC